MADIKQVIDEHNESTTLKVPSKFHFLEMSGIGIVIGLEIPESYEEKNIGKHIGNYLSKPPYNKLNWSQIFEKGQRSTLFQVGEKKLYKE